MLSRSKMNSRSSECRVGVFCARAHTMTTIMDQHNKKNSLSSYAACFLFLEYCGHVMRDYCAPAQAGGGALVPLPGVAVPLLGL